MCKNEGRMSPKMRKLLEDKMEWINYRAAVLATQGSKEATEELQLLANRMQLLIELLQGDFPTGADN